MMRARSARVNRTVGSGRTRGREGFAAPRRSESTGDGEDDEDDQDQTEPSARKVSPVRAVRPHRQRAEEKQDEDDEKDRAHRALLASDLLLIALKGKRCG